VTATQALLFEEAPESPRAPTIGSRWRYRTPLDRGRREDIVYDLESVDRDVDSLYCYRLRLVEIVSTSVPNRRVGEDTIHVELPWFTKNPYVSAAGGSP
jgi:hypothetical protein